MRNRFNWIKPFVYGVGLSCVQISIGNAALIAPGTGPVSVSPESDPVGGSVLFSTGTISWGPSFSFSGTLTSSVITGDTSNPWVGSGGLTFEYTLTLDSGSSDPASAITIGGFSGFQTDVSYQFPTTGLAPYSVTRSPASNLGKSLNFSFTGNGYLPPGGISALLVVQTDATTYSTSIATVTDDSGVPNILTLAPVNASLPVPEPTTAGCFLLGLGALACSRRLGSKA